MLNRLAALTTTLSLLVASPAVAAPEGWDSNHQQLLDALEAANVHVAINPPPLCADTKENDAIHGVYFYSDEHQQPVMGICQDFGGKGEEVQWTANDLDTLRHESVHFIQDCISGVDGEFDPLYDGPGGPSPLDDTLMYVVSALGVENAVAIQENYKAQGATDEVIRLELEAFLLAANIPAQMLAQSIQAQCPIK